MANFGGWAFASPKVWTHEKIRERYGEIAHFLKGGHIEYTKTPGYAHGSFQGKVISEDAKQLTDMDLLILMDRGNLCFGGYCYLTNEGSFHGKYYTD